MKIILRMSGEVIYFLLYFLRFSLKPSTLLRSSSHINPGVTSPGKTGQSTKAIDVNVDFELDVMVDIDSGQCVLHPKDVKVDQDADGRK